jgi:hypothetical protein
MGKFALGLVTNPLHLLAMLHFSTGPVKGDFFTNTVKKAVFASTWLRFLYIFPTGDDFLAHDRFC